VTGPTRTSQIVGRTVLAIVILGLGLTMCASPRAAEPERVWTVVNTATGQPVVSPRGHRATATNETACILATVEAASFLPAGTRLACRKTK
jgi:hypothetical protein